MLIGDHLKTFGWVLAQSKGSRSKLFWSAFFAGVSAILGVAPMVCVYFLAADFLGVGEIEPERVWGLMAVAVASVVLRFALYFAAMACSHICAFNVIYDLRASIATRLAALPLGFFEQRSSGEIEKIMTEDVENIELFIAHYFPDSVAAMALPLITALLLFWVDIPLTLASLAPLPLAFLMHLGMKRVYRKNVGAFHKNVEALNNAIVEYVRGMPVVKAFNQTAESFSRYKRALKRHTGIAEEWSSKASGFTSFFWVSLDLGLLVILPVGFLLLKSGGLSPAGFVLFMLLGPGIMEPLGRLIMVGGFLDRISEGVLRIQTIFTAKPLNDPQNGFTPKGHSIEFKNVTFAYDREPVLRDVSFALKEGTLNGFVGPSGAGKSTAARLIPRFWDISQGQILIEGLDIKQIPGRELMNKIGFVFQDVYLINDTVAENIRMGNQSATDDEVLAAAQSARAHGFISELPRGYQTVVGEGGAYLSGGEKQRISIARAFLKNAPILILDEATAFTDPLNENRIHEALNRLMQNRTVIMVAHRLPTVMHADQLLLFEGGKIKARGTHQEMLQDTLYSKLWNNCSLACDWKLAVGEAIDA
ncbi:ABC transporter ATP-binding protein [Dethiosulfatarculus sandiegensis]|uniref:Multidrug ABC transporter n=1 Tax=Dethiosulfatarculus sandiegensis TaxID=1429043 RepID=A0A0D2HV26_9BACT|nr:ABC transporter ATP-binding protein [Dethiosulfatarculus sandiegensis]KIX14278.1 multidrug ABC transporter [Dethiosulfatarculus sandiegensis]